jgi:coenzyme F420-0:L-glutamate ligase / coenzyme F420-1:gamma-L-glutamate ligase
MPDILPDAYTTLLALMRERRSIRRFRSDGLPDGTLERLMEAARWAPSASNRQPFRFLAIEKPETRARMADLVREAVQATLDRIAENERGLAASYAQDFVRFETAPLVLATYFRANNALAERFGMPADWDVGAVSSTSAAIMNLLLAAHALGLGACWMTGPLVAGPALEAFLDIPAGWRLSAIIPVGFADESPAPPRRRTSAQLLGRPGGSL